MNDGHLKAEDNGSPMNLMPHYWMGDEISRVYPLHSGQLIIAYLKRSGFQITP